jgi:hypothetical protein
MGILARDWVDWVDCVTVVMLSLTTVFSYLNESYGTAVLAGVCAGLVAGMQLARGVYRTR